MTTKRFLILTAGCLLAFGGREGSVSAQTAGEPMSKTCRVTRAREVEIQKIEPFKVFDNLYHVGPCYVSVWLLTTPQGDILFDSAQEPFVDKVIENIRKVGVNPRDIKYILINHGHLDHAGGAARLQELTGARVAAVAEDWTMIEALNGKVGNRDPKPNVTPKRDMAGKAARNAQTRRAASFCGPGNLGRAGEAPDGDRTECPRGREAESVEVGPGLLYAISKSVRFVTG